MTLATRFTLAAASGLLLAAAFPSVNLWVLAWIGFVPLLLAIRGQSWGRRLLLGWLAGFCWQVTTIYWIPATISNFTEIPPLAAKAILVLLAGFSAYPFVLLSVGVEWAAAGGIPRIVFAPLLWVVGEWLRVVVIAGFPWNPIGNTLIASVPLAQAADLGGVYLLSAVILAANVALADAWTSWRRGVSGAALRSVGVAAACPVLLLAYGSWRLAGLERIAYTGSLRVGITQGNIAQNEKWNAKLRDRILSKYLELTEKAAAAGAQLVVWPEAALPFYIQRDMRALELTRIARERGIDLLVGAPGLEDRDGTGMKPYNQAWLIRADGSLEGPYDKIQLVPFGEYIPFYGLFGLVDVAVQSVGQLGKGTSFTIFDTVPLVPPAGNARGGADANAVEAASVATHAASDAKSGGAKDADHLATGSDADTHATGSDAGTEPRRARFATLICYEGIFPTLTRQFAAEGPDFLVNISNDAWYGDTSAPHQHLAMAAMRAIENRLPMVRSTNTGISAFITDEGRIGSTTPLFQEDMAVETVRTRDVWSFYRVYGDVFLHTCQAAVAAMLLLAWQRRRLRPRA